MSDNQELFFSNGIDVTTGKPMVPALTTHQVVQLARGQRLNKNDFHLQDLQNKKQQIQDEANPLHLGTAEHVDPLKLEESGWGIIFAENADPAIYEALTELREHRQRQATRNNERFYREFRGNAGYRKGDSKREFLERHGVGSGPVDPENGVPYYLLIVGSPDEIPFIFQYQLDIQFAVGRIHFDNIEDYARYARSVVNAESGIFALPRHITFFGVENDNDRATQMSAKHLLQPMIKEIEKETHGWEITKMLGEGQATKANFSHLLGDQAPAILFTASHGAGFPNEHPQQRECQGAIICQDWPGPAAYRGPLKPDFYFAADDLASDAQITGTIAFFFACYGAGTPHIDPFFRQAFATPKPVAPESFLAALPQKMLCHPKGGALAVVGHIERNWSHSFMVNSIRASTEVFSSAIKQMMRGNPVGSAMEDFNERYSELATDLNAELEMLEFGKSMNEYEIASMWTAVNDARNYVILGDPAVRLPLHDKTAATHERPELGEISITPTVSGAHMLSSEREQSSASAASATSARTSTGITLSARTHTPRDTTTEPASPSSFSDMVSETQEGDLSESSNAALSPQSSYPLDQLIERWQQARAIEHKVRAWSDKCVRDIEEELERMRRG